MIKLFKHRYPAIAGSSDRQSTTAKMLLCVAFFITVCSCNKLVEVPEPVNTITTSETFSTPANATSALIQIYSDISTGDLKFGTGLITTQAGLSADELTYFDGGYAAMMQFRNNNLQSNNALFYGLFWSSAYKDVYYANAVIEGVNASSTLSESLKNQLTGEAKLLRAFIHFYLVNLFGDIPLVTTTSWASTVLLARAPTAQVYDQIIADLKDAQALLPNDYSVSGGERIRANKSSATALLARVYLYTGKPDIAEVQATTVINNTALYSLAPTLNNVFLKNNSEAILQWHVSNTIYPYAPIEGSQIVPPNKTTNPTYYCSDQLLNAFETGDKRKVVWIDTTKYSGTFYYYPNKYTVYVGTVNGNVLQYYMVLRLAEQYLIRAEARALQNNITGAIADLNTIRTRAGLPSLSSSLSQSQVLAAVAQERRAELFAEWGHRWLDLKRTGQALSVLSAIPYKSAITSHQLLYPIPLQELQTDPNLTQNPGY